MAISKTAEKIQHLVKPAVENLGYELWGIEYFPQAKTAVLRIYIDAENGINVDDCARTSHQVSGILDVEDPIAGEYNLEVSSPGLDRPLFNLQHFIKYQGSYVKLKLNVAIDGRKNFLGKIENVANEEIILHVEGQTYNLPYSYIAKANLDWGDKERP